MEKIPIEKAAIDSQVEIKVNGVDYRGTVLRINKDEGNIMIKDVEILKDGKTLPLPGPLRFHRDEIEGITFLDKEALLRKMDPCYMLMKPFRKPTHLRGQNIPSDDDILQLGRPPLEEYGENGSGDDASGACWSSSMKSQVIDKIDDSFASVIGTLKECKAVAVAAEGVLVSRMGELCWLSVATPTYIYLFDILSLGESAFAGGLADILQSTRILKIMHDCRYLSDYLYHKRGIFLQTVWDTQVARIINFKQKYLGDLPRYAEGLPKVLQDVLGVDPNSFPFLWYRSYAMEEDQAIWRQRPLPDNLQKVLEAQVSYLFDLRTALMENLLLELNIGVDTYLKVVRDAKNSEIESKLKGSFLVPAEFWSAAKAAKERYEEAKKKSTIDPLTGFRETVGRLSYWKVRFSRDSWHGQIGSNGAKDEGVEESEVD